MNYSQYGAFLASSTYDCTECAICLEELAASPGNRTTYISASCRLACGHVFHHDCVLQCYGSELTQCPLCRVEFLPSFPECGFCGISLNPSVPVSTLACCGTKMHCLCLDTWLQGSGDESMGCSVCSEQRGEMLAKIELLRDSDEEEDAELNSSLLRPTPNVSHYDDDSDLDGLSDFLEEAEEYLAEYNRLHNSESNSDQSGRQSPDVICLN